MRITHAYLLVPDGSRPSERKLRRSGTAAAVIDVQAAVQKLLDKHKPGWSQAFDEAYVAELVRQLRRV